MNRVIRGLQLISAKLLFIFGFLLAGCSLYVIGEQINMGFFVVQPFNLHTIVALIIGVACLASAGLVERLDIYREH